MRHLFWRPNDRDGHVSALIEIAFGLAHEISELCLDLECRPEMALHRFYGSQVADAGVCALAHIACASESWPPTIGAYNATAESVSGAQANLRALDRLLSLLRVHRRVPAEVTGALSCKVEEAAAVLTALEVELCGGRRMRFAG